MRSVIRPSKAGRPEARVFSSAHWWGSLLRACRARFLDDTLEVEHAWREPERPADPAPADPAPAAGGLAAWLVERLAEKTGVPAHRFDRRAPFADLGLDSLTVVELAGELRTIGEIEQQSLVEQLVEQQRMRSDLGGEEVAASAEIDEPPTRGGTVVQ